MQICGFFVAIEWAGSCLQCLLYYIVEHLRRKVCSVSQLFLVFFLKEEFDCFTQGKTFGS